MIERAFVTIAEGQVHMRRVVVADSTKRPVILIHASPSSSRWMVDLAESLAATGRSVFALDTLGNGDSPPPALPAPEIDYFADSVLRVADALGLDRFDVYGVHTGARIACELAAAHPARIGRIVLDGIKDYDDETRAKILAEYAPTVAPNEHGTHFVWAFHFVRDQALYFPHFEKNPAHRLPGFMPSPEILHHAAIDVLKALDTYSLPYLAAFRYRSQDRLPLIEGPVLMLKSELELAVLNSAVDEAAALLRDGTVAAVGADPKDKSSVIARFLDGTLS